MSGVEKKRNDAWEKFGELNLGEPKTMWDLANFMFDAGREAMLRESLEYMVTKIIGDVPNHKWLFTQDQISLIEEYFIAKESKFKGKP